MNMCLNCSRQFIHAARNPHQKFCSEICRRSYSYVLETRKCAECGNSFPVGSSHKNQKYCSTTCRDNARSTKVHMPCSWCGAELLRYHYRAERFENAYCSKSCEKKHKRQISKYQVDVENLTCETCGAPLTRCPSHVYSHNFCSEQCRTIWQRTSGYMDRENSPTWLGGHVDYRGPNWPTQRERALERDNYTCRNCGSTDSLQVHHDIPYQTFRSYLAANHLDNLRTLCNTCHITAEWEYRRSHSDLERIIPA